jgi:hypothetical protein
MWHRALPLLALGLAACSQDTTQGLTGDAASDLDGQVAVDAAGDAGWIDVDVGPNPGRMDADVTDALLVDAFVSDAEVQDAGMDDAGASVCDALALCCPNLPPRLQPGCNNAVASGDPMQCQRALQLAERAGACMPPDPDGGPTPIPDAGDLDGGPPPPPDGGLRDGGRPRPDSGLMFPDGGGLSDGGALGPDCTTLLLCCAMAPPGPLQNQCIQATVAADETFCGQILDRLQMNGLCN